MLVNAAEKIIMMIAHASIYPLDVAESLNMLNMYRIGVSVALFGPPFVISMGSSIIISVPLMPFTKHKRNIPFMQGTVM